MVRRPDRRLRLWWHRRRLKRCWGGWPHRHCEEPVVACHIPRHTRIGDGLHLCAVHAEPLASQGWLSSLVFLSWVRLTADEVREALKERGLSTLTELTWLADSRVKR